MARYKAKVVQAAGEKCEKQMGNIPEGTWFLKVLFKCIEKFDQEYEQFEPIVTEKDVLFDKKYFLSHDIITTGKQGEQRSLYECSIYFLEKDFGFAGNASDLQEFVVGMERELITDIDERGYENIKWINNPDGRKPLVKPGLEDEFANIFNKK